MIRGVLLMVTKYLGIHVHNYIYRVINYTVLSRPLLRLVQWLIIGVRELAEKNIGYGN